MHNQIILAFLSDPLSNLPSYIITYTDAWIYLQLPPDESCTVSKNLELKLVAAIISYPSLLEWGSFQADEEARSWTHWSTYLQDVSDLTPANHVEDWVRPACSNKSAASVSFGIEWVMWETGYGAKYYDTWVLWLHFLLECGGQGAAVLQSGECDAPNSVRGFVALGVPWLCRWGKESSSDSLFLFSQFYKYIIFLQLAWVLA